MGLRKVSVKVSHIIRVQQNVKQPKSLNLGLPMWFILQDYLTIYHLEREC